MRSVLFVFTAFFAAQQVLADAVSDRKDQVINRVNTHRLKSRDYTKSQIISAIEKSQNIDLVNIYEIIFDTSAEDNGIQERNLIYAMESTPYVKAVTLQLSDYGYRIDDVFAEFDLREANSQPRLNKAELEFLRFYLGNAKLLDVVSSQYFIYSFQQIVAVLMSRDMSQSDMARIAALFKKERKNNDILEFQVVEYLVTIEPEKVNKDFLSVIAYLMDHGSDKNGISEDVLVRKLVALQAEQGFITAANSGKAKKFLKAVLAGGEVRTDEWNYFSVRYSDVRKAIEAM